MFSQSMLDVTFGNRGKVVTAVNDTSIANDIAIQPDGKIVIGGSTTVGGRRAFAMVRYNTDGSINNTFGTSGKVVTAFSDRCEILSIAIQVDGKIVAGGFASHNASIFVDSTYAVARYKPNGSVDSLFGKNGSTVVKMPDGTGELKKLLIKQDGRIITAGSISKATFEYFPVLVQLNANGSIDSTFGTNGKVEASSNDIEKFTDMALARDGKILVTGQIKNWNYIGDFALLRYLANGKPDSSFGTNGVVKTDFNGNINNNKVENALGLVVLPDSSIVLTGYNYTTPATFALAKYKTNGTLDSTFGTNGKVVSPVHSINGYAQDVLADIYGNLFVSGYAAQNSNSDFAIAKYLYNGKLDSSFGRNGIDTTNFFGYADVAYASALQNDGKIVLAGQAANTNSSYNIALARYTLTVLPLKLLNISAIKQGETNLLQWTTVNEINVAGFEIERSVNGKDYNSIGKMKPGLNKYNFTDANPLKGTNYYRIKVVDKDGKFEYSSIRMLTGNNIFYVSVYPLPAKNILNVQIQADKMENANISITDMSGKTLVTKSLRLASGANTISLNVSSLGKAVYFLKVIIEGKLETRKITVE